ncbi:MAG: prepilin peptidase [Thermodesulfobacteriota bacterium]
MPELFVEIFVFIIAAVIGSFLNVCILRIPLGASIVYPPSSCPSCKAKIRGYDNIPILSYLILRGACRNCKESISIRYPFIEALSAVLALLLYEKFGLGPDFFVFTLLTFALVVITFIDFDHQIIPDRVSVSGIPLGFLASLLLTRTTYIDSIIGILAGGGFLLFIALFYHFIFKKEGMGGGDIKLLAMIGAFVGWQGVIFVVFFSSLVGSIAGILYIVLSGKGAKSPIPFGPFLALGAYVYLLVGTELIDLYLVSL